MIVATWDRSVKRRGVAGPDIRNAGCKRLLEALYDPKREADEEMTEWVGGEFDPEALDLGGINQSLWCMP